MKIELHRMKLRNFKGCKELTVDFNGKDTHIYGDNGTGKSTVDDAFHWVLFDKNSMGVSSFEVKPIGADRPQVEVECTLKVDDRVIVLRKMLEEQWTKKRGYEEETFTGHITSYWVNDIPKKATEYKAFVDAIVSEDTFKQITNATFFLSMKKTEMRKSLVDRAGGIKDEDIAGNDKEQRDLVTLMQDKGYSVDDLLKLCKQNITTYNSEQTNINPRIDEVRRSVSEDTVDYDEIEEKIAKGRDYIAKVDLALSSAQEQSKIIAEKQKAIFELQNKIESYRREQLAKANEERNKTISLRAQLNTHAIQLKGNIDTINQKLYNISDGLNQVTENQKLLVANYKYYAQLKKENAEKVFEPIAEGSETCDKCGQAFPPEMIAQMNDEALKLFEQKKSEIADKCEKEISEITNKGQMEKTRKTNFELQQTDLLAQKEKLESELKMAESQIKVATDKIDSSIEANEIDLAGDPEYDIMVSNLEELRDSINSSGDNSQKLIDSRRQIQERVDELTAQLSRKGDAEKAEKRIAELTARGKELAGLIAQEKAIQYQAEKFIRAKAEALQESINAMFENLSFRLFEVQINGGIADDCTPMIHGVEYGNASNSERIRANMDIINAMQKSANIYAPVFIDNAEACTHFRKMNCQMIYLTVSEQDKKLRIEREE